MTTYNDLAALILQLGAVPGRAKELAPLYAQHGGTMVYDVPSANYDALADDLRAKLIETPSAVVMDVPSVPPTMTAEKLTEILADADKDGATTSDVVAAINAHFKS